LVALESAREHEPRFKATELEEDDLVSSDSDIAVKVFRSPNQLKIKDRSLVSKEGQKLRASHASGIWCRVLDCDSDGSIVFITMDTRRSVVEAKLTDGEAAGGKPAWDWAARGAEHHLAGADAGTTPTRNGRGHGDLKPAMS